jgi:chorismate dehydratase
MRLVRLGAVGYLNARPLVFGIEDVPPFTIRYDVPAECARLLHAGAIDLGLIPSIEYLAAPEYRIVPDVAIASFEAVASVALFTGRPVPDIRTVAIDTSSRTSVALFRILCRRAFNITPELAAMPPDLDAMLDRADAALVIGDTALFAERGNRVVDKVDLGEEWTRLTGLPFVWAFWAGRHGAVHAEEVRLLQRARDEGVRCTDAIARAYFPDQPRRQAAGAQYLRDNIKYRLGEEEREALQRFYRYAAETGVVSAAAALRFHGPHDD